jgi:rhamnosyltransferase
MKDKTVDILMATYNGSKYIQEQINSILSQSYKNFNLIIRDDNSTDNTMSIIKKLQKNDIRIKIIEDNKGNLGVSKNFEALLKYSNADYLMFSDQDDIWLPNKVLLLLQKIIEINNVPDQPTLVYSESTVVNDKLEIIRHNIYPSGGLDTDIKNLLFTNGGIQGSSMIFNRKLKELILPIPDEIYMHDAYATLLALLFGKIGFVNQPLMYYRQHDSNVLGVKKSGAWSLFQSLFIEKVPLIEKEQIVLREIIYNEFKEKISTIQKKTF